MLSTKDVTMIYETLLSSPGMYDGVRIDLKVPRKNVLFLARIIEFGLALKDQAPKSDLLQSVSNDNINELNTVTGELLNKSGLTD